MVLPARRSAAGQLRTLTGCTIRGRWSRCLQTCGLRRSPRWTTPARFGPISPPAISPTDAEWACGLYRFTRLRSARSLVGERAGAVSPKGKRLTEAVDGALGVRRDPGDDEIGKQGHAVTRMGCRSSASKTSSSVGHWAGSCGGGGWAANRVRIVDEHAVVRVTPGERGDFLEHGAPRRPGGRSARRSSGRRGTRASGSAGQPERRASAASRPGAR